MREPHDFFVSRDYLVVGIFVQFHLTTPREVVAARLGTAIISAYFAHLIIELAIRPDS